jgi:hypothetical protein
VEIRQQKLFLGVAKRFAWWDPVCLQGELAEYVKRWKRFHQKKTKQRNTHSSVQAKSHHSKGINFFSNKKHSTLELSIAELGTSSPSKLVYQGVNFHTHLA